MLVRQHRRPSGGNRTSFQQRKQRFRTKEFSLSSGEIHSFTQRVVTAVSEHHELKLQTLFDGVMAPVSLQIAHSDPQDLYVLFSTLQASSVLMSH